MEGDAEQAPETLPTPMGASDNGFLPLPLLLPPEKLLLLLARTCPYPADRASSHI